MTVRTADLALLDFCKYRRERPAIGHNLVDGAPLFATNVVELEHDWVRFTAVDARVRLQICEDDTLIFGSLSLVALANRYGSRGVPARIVLAMDHAVALAAIRGQLIALAHATPELTPLPLKVATRTQL